MHCTVLSFYALVNIPINLCIQSVISAKFHLLPFGFHILYAQEKTEHLQEMFTIAMSNKPYILNIHFFKKREQWRILSWKWPNLVPRGPFCHVLEIRTPGQVQRHAGFEWLCKPNKLRPEPIRFVRLDSEQFAEWWEVHESRTSGFGPGQRSQSPSLTKRIVASGNEIENGLES